MVTDAPLDSERRVLIATAALVRAAVARCLISPNMHSPADLPQRLGAVRLRPHQLEAAARLAHVVAERGGALLADEVGLGKTYVALALARGAERPLVVAPAALLPMWRGALDRARVSAALVSFERLSRAGDAAAATNGAPDPDLVIVDEAHHARTPTTRRYAALARLCARSRVLLLSATPLHNSRRDLTAQLALFLGATAWTMTDAELSRLVVRRTRADVCLDDAGPPAVAPPVWIELAAADDCLEQLLALPPPLPPADGGDGGALLAYSLVRQWASSRAALRAALRRRLARAVALTAALESGRYPSREELEAWSYAEGAVQLAFPELVAPAPYEATAGDGRADPGALLAAVRAHETAVGELLATLERAPDPDLDRAAAIRGIRSRHAGERVIAFAESVETVEAMFRLLRADPGVAMLRARGAAVAGGTLTRQEALSRFAPLAQGAPQPAPAERIDLLLATDLLSEGVNLQDASVVVHLDLPWNPARLEQRVGRVSRIGSAHARVAVYALRPPAPADRLLAVERRLREKIAAARRSVGVVGAILPGLGGATSERSAAEDWNRVHAVLHAWHLESAPTASSGDEVRPLVAAVHSSQRGFVAALSERGTALLLASLGGAPSTAPSVVARAMEDAAGAERTVDERALDAALRAIEAWSTRRAASALSGVDGSAVARARRHVLSRITSAASRAPRHLRSVFGPLAADARRAALLPLGEGAERILAELADAPLADEAWLRAVAAFGAVHARRPNDESGHGAAGCVLVALLLLQE